MDKYISDAVRFLLNARMDNKIGWGQEFQSVPSVTVTAEVGLALMEYLDSGRKENEALVRQCIVEALEYTRNNLPTHKDPDLPNFASTMLLLLHQYDPCDNALVIDTCLKGILGLKSNNGWKSSKNDCEPNYVATYLSMICLNHLNSKYSTIITPDNLRNDVTEAVAESQYILMESNHYHDENARISCLMLAARSSKLKKNLVDQFGSDSQVLNICANIIKDEQNIKDEWILQLNNTNYKMFYLTPAIIALSDGINTLNDNTLYLYYKMAKLLISENMIGEHRGFNYWKQRNNEQSKPKVWVTAHALRALLKIPIRSREIIKICGLVENNKILSVENNKLTSDLDKCIKTVSDTINDKDVNHIDLWNPNNKIFWIRTKLKSLFVFWLLCLALCFTPINSLIVKYEDIISLYPKIPNIIMYLFIFIITLIVSYKFLQVKYKKESNMLEWAGPIIEAIGISATFDAFIWILIELISKRNT